MTATKEQIEKIEQAIKDVETLNKIKEEVEDAPSEEQQAQNCHTWIILSMSDNENDHKKQKIENRQQLLLWASASPERLALISQDETIVKAVDTLTFVETEDSAKLLDDLKQKSRLIGLYIFFVKNGVYPSNTHEVSQQINVLRKTAKKKVKEPLPDNEQAAWKDIVDRAVVYLTAAPHPDFDLSKKIPVFKGAEDIDLQAAYKGNWPENMKNTVAISAAAAASFLEKLIAWIETITVFLQKVLEVAQKVKTAAQSLQVVLTTASKYQSGR